MYRRTSGVGKTKARVVTTQTMDGDIREYKRNKKREASEVTPGTVWYVPGTPLVRLW
jgi:hypothetical protein